jgi:hypothetical protein
MHADSDGNSVGYSETSGHDVIAVGRARYCESFTAFRLAFPARGICFALCLVAFVLVAPSFSRAAIDPSAVGSHAERPLHMSGQQKQAALRPSMRQATECIVHSVSADSRLPEALKAHDIGELIVDAMQPCVRFVRAMIDRYDSLFGEGEGELFFMNSYLSLLPELVLRVVEEK